MNQLINQEEFVRLFEKTPVPMVVMAADACFTIVGMSDAYLRITMTKREGILGKGMFEAFPGNPSMVDSNGMFELRHSLEHVITHREPHSMALVKYDIRREDGDYEERYWSATHTPIFDNGDSNTVKFILQHTEDVTQLVLQAERDEKRQNAHKQLEIRTERMEAEILRRVQELESANIKLEESEIKLRRVVDEAQTWQSRYGAAIEASEQVMYDWNTATNEVLFAGNVTSILGYSNHELTGPMDKWLSVVHPEDVKAFNNEIARVLKQRVPFRLTFRVIRKDGRIIYCEDNGNFFCDAQDNVQRMVGFIRDVTRDTELEHVLQDSEEKFRTMADTISHLAWMADASGKIVWYNKRWLEYTGTTLEQMLNGYSVVLPEAREKVVEKFQRHISAGEPWEDTFQIRSASGDYRWFLSRAMPIRDDNGNLIRWFGTNTDVTTQRETEQALREREEKLAELNYELERARDEALAASEAKSTFLAIMSHELRTPLNAIIGYAEMLRDDALSGKSKSDEIAADLERIAGSGQHLLLLISDILDFSKIEAGQMEMANEPVDLSLLIKEAVDTINPQCKAKGNRLQVEARTTVNEVRGDFMRLKQILINLLGNAAKFTENGSIHLRYGVAGAGENPDVDDDMSLWFEIEDTGIGIPQTNMPLLYERFRQGDSSHTRRHGGTGLGLAITKRLVELMGGAIEVNSVVGKGTSFRVTVPMESTVV